MENPDFRLQPESFLEAFCVELKSILSGYLKLPNKASVSLTGGLDSRIVMACLPPDNQIHCYTFGSMYRDTYDVKIARRVAEHCGNIHHTLVLGNDFLRDFSRILNKAVYISDGYIGFSVCI